MTIQADEIYTVLSHPVRLRATILIKHFKELCVCELIHALELQQPVVSRHLSQLKAAGLLESRKSGLWVYYRISDDLPDWVNKVLNETIKGVGNEAPYKNDVSLIESMQDRPEQSCC